MTTIIAVEIDLSCGGGRRCDGRSFLKRYSEIVLFHHNVLVLDEVCVSNCGTVNYIHSVANLYHVIRKIKVMSLVEVH